MKRFCVKCQKEKPREGFKLQVRGRTKFSLCGDCSSRKVPATQAERDAYGEQTRQENKEAARYANQTNA